MKRNWKTYQNYFLLLAMAFRMVVMASFLTLASHNICMAHLLAEDASWTKLMLKQKKRPDDQSYQISDDHCVLQPNKAGNVVPTRYWILPALQFTKQQFPIIRRQFSRLYFIPRLYRQEKKFLLHCTLLT